MKRILLFAGLFIFLATGIVFAQNYQTSQSVITNVGKPPIGGGNRSQIAEIISERLTRGSDRLYNKIDPNPFRYPGSSYNVIERGPNPPGYPDSTDAGYFYCTSLVVDVFNISGMKLSDALGNVNTMIDFWKSTEGQRKGFHYLDYYSVKISGSKSQQQYLLSQVKPGDAIFYANTGYCGRAAYCHTGIVYDVKLNNAGDGYIETREANAWITKRKIPVSSWKIVGPWSDAGSFGGTNI